MLKKLFFIFFVKPLILFVSGVHLKNRQNLPKKNSPAIIVSNHNSHLDTLTLMSLFPIKDLDNITPIGAKDYFFKNPFIRFISKYLIEVTPIDREMKKSQTHPLANVYKALEENKIIILYPEGSRGEPEELKTFKSGIAHLAKKYPSVPIYPVFMYGTGRSLPKGEALFVPFIIDINIGEALYFDGSLAKEFTCLVEERILELKRESCH